MDRRQPVLQTAAMPLHLQRLQQTLNLTPFLREVERSLLCDERSETYPSNASGASPVHHTSLGYADEAGLTKKLSSYDSHLYNFTHVTREREWIKDLLLSESEEEDEELDNTEKLAIMLELRYKMRKRWRLKLKRLAKIREYQYLSAGLVLPTDRYLELKKKRREERIAEAQHKAQLKKTNEQKRALFRVKETKRKRLEVVKEKEQRDKEREQYRVKLWAYIAKKEVPKMAKMFAQARHTILINNKKIALFCQREVRRCAVKSQRMSKEVSGVVPRARRIMREMLVYWKKHEKVEKELRKKAEKEAVEQQRMVDEMREAKRQQRKLNFLITQTELYAHFMARKSTGEKSTEDILSLLDDKPLELPPVSSAVNVEDDYDCDVMKERALVTVQNAVQKQKAKHQVFAEAAGQSSDLQESFDRSFSLANPSMNTERQLPQPSLFKGQLKVYQLKGMNWLASLYDQGINGILADEMGLGKTVQSIALLSHLAECQDIWGPFLIVSPASTLHNWQQECTRFVPSFKVLPYWGSPHERKVIRKYWNQKLLYKRNAPFHILISSYQLVVQDFKYFQRIKWQYMILDEAQAIKSSSSVRWKMLMSFNCRNRLLLTGTPIQNTMAELWALLHFIMPTMFDSHEEFNEWFSRDIESHAEKRSALDENQLSRLHMILKPFMLRRIKKDVEHEMAEKVEVHLRCALSTRQRRLYHRLRERISIDDLLHSSNQQISKDSTSHLMNLVMQFRKVCNHPDLFEHRDVHSPLHLTSHDCVYPRLIYDELIQPSLIQLRLLIFTLGVLSSSHIHSSSLSTCDLWSFLRLSGLSLSQAATIMTGPLYQWLQASTDLSDNAHNVYQQRVWHSPSSSSELLLWPSFTLSPAAVANSSILQPLVFTSHTSHTYTHTRHSLLSLRGQRAIAELKEISSTVSETTDSSSLVGVSDGGACQRVELRECVPTEMPLFLLAPCSKVLVTCQLYNVSSRSAEHSRLDWIRGGSHHLKSTLQHGVLPSPSPINTLWLSPSPPKGFAASLPYGGWSRIQIPDKECMVTDSGKMSVLDKLLSKLKIEGHRVLIYSQMTRMIDILEEYMGYRCYRYIRLDGSSRISDRRDMVEDFQTKSDIFVFLLSTRAGGLGINLTAADTVIFYDSDWNPTVDQQAMDRAHRLGQTKQVTVYRLIVQGSIEERILQRAKEKSEIQNMVISGGDFKSDTLKPKEVVSLLLDDDEMETRFLTKQAERKAQEEQQQVKKKAKKRKNIVKSVEGTPPSKKAISNHHSISPSPSGVSRPSSTTSLTSDLTNGRDTIDTGPNHIRKRATDTPTRVPKRQSKNNSLRVPKSKKPASGRSTPTHHAFSHPFHHSNSSPSSTSTNNHQAVANSSPHNELLYSNSRHSSPCPSPLPPAISITPPSARTLVTK